MLVDLEWSTIGDYYFYATGIVISTRYNIVTLYYHRYGIEIKRAKLISTVSRILRFHKNTISCRHCNIATPIC